MVNDWVNRWLRAMTTAAAIVGLASISTAVSPAQAQTQTPADSASNGDTAAARAHFKTGTTFYDLGKYDDAIREFEAAYQAKSDPAFLYNLAQAHRLAGHPAEALHFYRTYLRYVPDPPNLAYIQTHMRALEKLVAGKPATAAATPTAPPAATTPAPPTDASSNLPPPAPAEPADVPINAPPVLPNEPLPTGVAGMPTQPAVGGWPPPSNDLPKSDLGASRRKLGKTLTIVGASVFGVGIIFGLAAVADSDRVEKASVFDPAVEQRGKSFEGAQWVGYVLGGLTAGVGIYLVATARKVESTAAIWSPRTTAATTATLLPLAGPNFGGALLRMRFQ